MARFETVLGEFVNIPASDNNWRKPDRTHTPPPVKFCDDFKTDENIFQQPATGSLTCRVPDLMYQIASTQLEHFLVNYEHDTQRFLRDGFYNMVHGWRDMADSNEDTCGFTSSVENKPGYVGNCLTLCVAIKDSNNPSDFAGLLNDFDTFFRNNFDYFCKYHLKLTKFKNKIRFLNINLSRNNRPSGIKNHM